MIKNKKSMNKIMNMMITLIYIQLIRQDDGYEYDEKKLLFRLIGNVLSLLNLINLNMYVINMHQFDLLS